MISEESTAEEIEERSYQLEDSVRRFEEPITMMLYKMPSTNGRRKRQSRIGKNKRVTLREEKKRRKLKRCVKSYRDRLGSWEINQRKKRLNFLKIKG